MSSYPGLEQSSYPGGSSWGSTAPLLVRSIGTTEREAVRRALMLKTTMLTVLDIPRYWGHLDTWFVKHYLDDSPAGRTIAQACVQLPESTLAKVPLYAEGCIQYFDWTEVLTFTGKVMAGKNPLKGGVLKAIVQAVTNVTVRIIEVVARRLAVTTAAKAAVVVPYIGWVVAGVAHAADLYLTYEAVTDLWNSRERLVEAMLNIICPQ